VGCRRQAAPQELVRLSLGPPGTLRLGRPGGRGAWVCDDACLARAQARGALARALRGPVPGAEVERAVAVLAGRHQGGAGLSVCEDGTPGAVQRARPDEERKGT